MRAAAAEAAEAERKQLADMVRARSACARGSVVVACTRERRCCLLLLVVLDVLKVCLATCDRTGVYCRVGVSALVCLYCRVTRDRRSSNELRRQQQRQLPRRCVAG